MALTPSDPNWWLLWGGAILPPLLFALAVRAIEKFRREPLRVIAGLFVYGGTLGVAAAVGLSYLGFNQTGLDGAAGAVVLGAVLVAPITEELGKAIGLRVGRAHLDEPEDGIVHGAAIGLGFAATENLLYGYQALSDGGAGMLAATLVARMMSSTVLHACSTALVGFAYCRARLRVLPAAVALPAFLVAVLLHATYNGLVVLVGVWGYWAAVALVVSVAFYLRRVVRRLDAPGAPA